MAIPQKVRDAAAEADLSLQQLAASATPPPAPTVPAPADPNAPPPAPAPTEPVSVEPAPAPPPAPTAQPTTPETELQRLHAQLQTEAGRRATTEAEMQELRGRLAQLNEQIASNRQPAPAPAPAAPVELITDADRKDFGEDMVDFVVRAVKQQYGATIQTLIGKVNTLEGQLRQVGQQAKHAQQTSEEIAVEKYFQTLDKLVPDWRAVNDDPAFVDWLKNRDTFSRKTRHELLKSAHAGADAETVAEFFKAYKQEQGVSPAAPPAPTPTTTPPTPSVDPSTLVAPAPSNAPAPSVNPRGGKIWTQAEIEQVYEDRMKKRITPERFAELEREFMQALSEGRVQ